MGANEFTTSARGKTAADAFKKARADAQYESGHGGYTGTIAEKHEFVMMTPPFTRAECPNNSFQTKVYDWVETLLTANDRRIADKWGPCGCVQLSPTEFIFFGVASS